MRAAIIHGTGGYPERNWFPWLQNELESRGIETKVPRFPTPDGQNIDAWLEMFFREVGEVAPDLLLIGHSSGAVMLVNLLHHAAASARATFLVAGFVRELGIPEIDRANESFLATPFDWSKVRANAGEVFVYAGENDSYVPLQQGLELARNLSTELVLVPNGGHLNQDSGYRTFPRLLQDMRFLLND